MKMENLKFVVVFVSICVAFSAAVPSFGRFRVEEEGRLVEYWSQNIEKGLEHPRNTLISWLAKIDTGILKSGKKPGLKTYAFKNCIPVTDEKLVVDSLVLKPDPLVFPGPLEVSFNIQATDLIDAPVKANVIMSKKVGSTWIQIPCISNIGSCTYADLCEMLSEVDCPPSFTAAGVPCRCPLNKGDYKLPVTNFDVLSAVFPPGDYHVQANLTTGSGKAIGCYDILATFG